MSDRYRFGPFELNATEHDLRAQGRPVALAGRPFDTLLYLLRHPGRLVTREELIDAVWGETIVEEGNLHWTISVVRRTLAQESAESWIETVRGLGYRFVGQVEAAAAADPPSPSPENPLSPSPDTPPEISGGRGRWWLAAGLAAVLLLAVAWTVASRRQVAPAGAASLAIVGFRNLSPRQTEGWVGTALAEMLAADLGSGKRGTPLQLIPGDEVAIMRRDLGLHLEAPLGRAELAKIRRHLGSEWVLLGSYLVLPGEDAPLQVEALLRDTGTGETLAAVSRRGRQGDLFELSDSLASDLRRALGEPATTADGEARALPATPGAQRLYAEGLAAYQDREPALAIEKLQAAAAVEPRFPTTWLVLAQAQELLGSGAFAQTAAQKAVEQAGGWPERQRLAAQIVFLHAAHRLPEAVEATRRLYELSGHSFEDGLALGDLLLRSGRPQDALALIAGIRREHPVERDDARLALIEADSFSWQDDNANTAIASERAVAAARQQGMAHIEIMALHKLAIARIHRDGAPVCEGALAEIALARRKAEASGDRLLLSGVLLDLGAALMACDRPDQAEATQQETLAVLRSAGAFAKMAPLLFNLGASRLRRGDLLGADPLMREALATCESHGGALCRERFLHPIGVNRLHRGELAEARRMIGEGIALNLRLGNETRVAEARSFLPDLAAWGGDLARAVELQRQVVDAREKRGEPRAVAFAHSDLAYWLADAGRGAEALEHARRAMALASEQVATVRACSQASLAFAELASGDPAAADRDSAAALAQQRPPRNPFCSFMVWRVRSQVLLARGRLADAAALIDEGLDLARRNGFVTYELQGRLFRAQLAGKRGRSAEARQLAEDLAAEARAKGFGLIARRCAGLGAPQS
jgi:DNA-binding winged helix-turn-helix (wHTH) protein/predicted Zn-dependent protease